MGWASKIRPKAILGSIVGRFSNIYKCRPEVVGDARHIWFGWEYVGIDVCKIWWF